MNFKAQAKQNQLLERISTQHLVVGIDIAQQSHVARAVNFRGITLGTPLHFSNNDAGFNQLLQWMKDMQETHQLNDTIIGMEPTGAAEQQKKGAKTRPFCSRMRVGFQFDGSPSIPSEL